MASSTRARSSAIYIHDGDSSPSKSSSNLRSFFASKIHKKEPDASPGDEGLLRSSASTPYLPLPPQHRSRQQHQPGEEQRLQYPLSEREPPNMKSKSSRLEDTRKRNKSVISLKSFINSDKQDRSEARDISPSRDSQQHASHHQASSSRSSPKKSKSSTNLSFLFKRSSQSKENILPPAEPNKENDRRNSPQSYSRQRSGTQEIRESHQTGIRHYPAANPTDPRRRTMGPQELSSLHALYDPLGLSKESPPIQVGTGVSPRSPNRTNAPPLDDVKSNHMSRKSHVAALVDIFNNKGTASTPTTKDLSPQEVETAFESLLESRNISHQMRDKIRSLDPNIKAEFVKKDQIEECPRPRTSTNNSIDNNRSQTRKERGRSLFMNGGFSLSKETLGGQGTEREKSRRRSRSRTAHSSKDTRHSSENNRPESASSGKRRPLSLDLSKPVSSLRSMRSSIGLGSANSNATSQEQPDEMADPGDFVHYLQEIRKPELVSTSRIHKLRILLRNETVAWVDEFITIGGLSEVIGLLYRILQVEWREQHEDTLLHEILLCLKGLSTTSLALQELCAVEDELFPTLLKMLYDEEKKGPAEFTTRGIIITLLFTYLTDTVLGDRASRARKIMSYLRDPAPPEEEQPPTFIASMHQPRPYRAWCKEVSGVTKEVFWIFLHPTNIIPLPRADEYRIEEEQGRSYSFEKRFYPPPRAPAPAAPYVGGVEWDATVYVANHLQLMNAIIASLPTREERNGFRDDIRGSGFEKVMGASLRTCKEKFFGHVHEGLKLWVAAARADGWPYMDVREGPAHPLPKGAKRRVEPPPRVDLPLDLDLH